MAYSSRKQLDALLATYNQPQSKERASAFVLDMDGNVLCGFDEPNRYFREGIPGKYFDVSRQHFPSDADMSVLVSEGRAVPVIFATKGLDVRLPKPLVSTLNRCIASDDPFTINFLTSRGFDEASHVLEMSGVEHPERVTLVADSGNTIQAGGRRRDVRTLTDEERAYLAEFDLVADEANHGAAQICKRHGLGVSNLPAIEVERKSAARNLHYRALLDALGTAEDSLPAGEIEYVIERAINRYLARSPIDKATGGPAFTLIPGQATYEVKLPGANKASGLRAIMEEMQATGRHPESVTFAGDDVYKWKRNFADDVLEVDGKFGTDHPAMEYAKNGLAVDFPKSRGHVIHTHHPLRTSLLPPESDDEKRLASTPDPMKAIPESSALHSSKPGGVDLVTATPYDTASFVINAVRRMEQARDKPSTNNVTDAHRVGQERIRER